MGVVSHFVLRVTLRCCLYHCVNLKNPVGRLFFKIASTVMAVIVVGSFALAGAGADVFHKYWIRGPIFEAYERVGGFGFFGDATRAEAQLADGGRFQTFSRGSSIYYHPDVAGGVAHQVGGLIRDKWGQLGWETGDFGYPVTDELSLPNREGRFNHFEGGSIYWSPQTGAHPVSGRIVEYWKSRGWENSHLGLPVGDPQTVGLDVEQQFENGWVSVVPKSVVGLPEFEPAPHSAFEMRIPILPADVGVDSVTAHLTPVGLNQQMIRDFGQYFPFAGCEGSLFVGKSCELTTVAGQTETVVVSVS